MAELYNMKDDLIANIRTRGYTSPTAIQMQAIPLMLNKREILACAPTGSGKTAAFLVPIIHTLDAPQKKGFRAVIVAPTRELANQIHRECVKLSEGRGLRCHVIENVTKAAQKFGPKSSQRFGIQSYKFYSARKMLIYFIIFYRYFGNNTKPTGSLIGARATCNFFKKVTFH